MVSHAYSRQHCLRLSHSRCSEKKKKCDLFQQCVFACLLPSWKLFWHSRIQKKSETNLGKPTLFCSLEGMLFIGDRRTYAYNVHSYTQLNVQGLLEKSRHDTKIAYSSSCYDMCIHYCKNGVNKSVWIIFRWFYIYVVGIYLSTIFTRKM